MEGGGWLTLDTGWPNAAAAGGLPKHSHLIHCNCFLAPHAQPCGPARAQPIPSGGRHHAARHPPRPARRPHLPHALQQRRVDHARWQPHGHALKRLHIREQPHGIHGEVGGRQGQRILLCQADKRRLRLRHGQQLWRGVEAAAQGGPEVGEARRAVAPEPAPTCTLGPRPCPWLPTWRIWLTAGSWECAHRCTYPPLPPKAKHSPELLMAAAVSASPSVSTWYTAAAARAGRAGVQAARSAGWSGQRAEKMVASTAALRSRPGQPSMGRLTRHALRVCQGEHPAGRGQQQGAGDAGVEAQQGGPRSKGHGGQHARRHAHVKHLRRVGCSPLGRSPALHPAWARAMQACPPSPCCSCSCPKARLAARAPRNSVPWRRCPEPAGPCG